MALRRRSMQDPGFEIPRISLLGSPLVLAALMLVGGFLGDRYDRRRVFALGVVMFPASSLWCALAAGPVVL